MGEREQVGEIECVAGWTSPSKRELGSGREGGRGGGEV